MNLEEAALKTVSKLMLKVFTPMMAFIYAFYGGIAYILFLAHSASPTFNFNAAIWTWLWFALLLTPLLGVLMFLQTVKALGIDYMAIIHMIVFKEPYQQTKSSRKTKQKKQRDNSTDSDSLSG